MSVNKEPLGRFIHVLVSLSQVYDLPLTSLHVFYDLKGGLIAFNRNGSIFLNLRYYQEWRKWYCLFQNVDLFSISAIDDIEVRKGNLNPAFISW
jgi:hypothetical protein